MGQRQEVSVMTRAERTNLPKFNDGSVIPRIYFKLGK